MRRKVTAFLLLALSVVASAQTQKAGSDFPRTVRVRLWYLHPPQELRIRADAGQAQANQCNGCKAASVRSLVLRASASSLSVTGQDSRASYLRVSGKYEMAAADHPPIRADFPIEIRADHDRLLVTAWLPMEEYVAAVLAGEMGSFRSDEALKAMAVAARTYAVHFGARHPLEGFDFCDTTHCQDVRLTAMNPRLRRIAESTAGELLWYDGEPAAAYYFANCGGRTEDGRYILGNDEAPAPYLKQHSDQFCVRNGGTQWSSAVSKRDLQQALAADGIAVPGTLRSVSVLQRTASGRVEFLRVTGSGSVTVSGLAFRLAVGRHIGWERLKSNWYEVSDGGDQLAFHGRGAGHGVGLCQVGAEVMAEEGRSYREILAFYYPGTRMGVAAQGTRWQQLANADVELLTTRPERDRSLIALATRFLHDSEESTGLVYRARPRLKVYATVADFRNTTGEPGWIAASTRGRTISMQPPDVLRRAGTLDATIHHELLHMLIESYATPGTPRWFREGLVLYFTSPADASEARMRGENVTALENTLRSPQSEAELRRAYADARSRVAQLARERGKATLLGWLQNGLPPELFASATARPGAR